YPALASMAPDGKTVLLPGENGTVRIVSIETGKLTAAPRFHGNLRVVSARYSQDGEEVVSLDQGGTLVVWSPKNGEVSRFIDTARAARQVALSPDRQFVLAYGAGDAIVLYDALNGKEIQILRGHTHVVVDAAFSPDGRYLLSVGLDRTL